MYSIETQVQFDNSERTKQCRLAELLLRQAAMQYAMLRAFEWNMNQHVDTKTCEPPTRYIAAAIHDFNWRFLNGSDGEFKFDFQVKLTDDMRGVVVTWDGQNELAQLMGNA